MSEKATLPVDKKAFDQGALGKGFQDAGLSNNARQNMGKAGLFLNKRNHEDQCGFSIRKLGRIDLRFALKSGLPREVGKLRQLGPDSFALRVIHLKQVGRHGLTIENHFSVFVFAVNENAQKVVILRKKLAGDAFASVGSLELLEEGRTQEATFFRQSVEELAGLRGQAARRIRVHLLDQRRIILDKHAGREPNEAHHRGDQ